MAINDRVVLEIPEGPWAGQYVTRVELTAPGRLALALPRVGGVPVTVAEGAELFVVAFRSDPVRGGRFRARAKVLAPRERDQRAELLWVGVDQWERVQLRSFLRVPALVTVRWRLAGKGGGGPWQTAQSRDVGGGGLLLWLAEPLEVGSRLELVVELPAGRIRSVGEVVRVVSPARPETRGVGVAVRFLEIAEADRDRIIAFALRRQAELRRMQTD